MAHSKDAGSLWYHPVQINDVSSHIIFSAEPSRALGFYYLELGLEWTWLTACRPLSQSRVANNTKKKGLILAKSTKYLILTFEQLILFKFILLIQKFILKKESYISFIQKKKKNVRILRKSTKYLLLTSKLLILLKIIFRITSFSQNFALEERKLKK